jgi:hypothetical protein
MSNVSRPRRHGEGPRLATRSACKRLGRFDGLDACAPRRPAAIFAHTRKGNRVSPLPGRESRPFPATPLRARPSPKSREKSDCVLPFAITPPLPARSPTTKTHGATTGAIGARPRRRNHGRDHSGVAAPRSTAPAKSAQFAFASHSSPMFPFAQSSSPAHRIIPRSPTQSVIGAMSEGASHRVSLGDRPPHSRRRTARRRSAKPSAIPPQRADCTTTYVPPSE